MDLYEYKILRALTVDELEKLVNMYLAEEWMPTGGVVFAGLHYMQAIVRNR